VLVLEDLALGEGDLDKDLFVLGEEEIVSDILKFEVVGHS